MRERKESRGCIRALSAKKTGRYLLCYSLLFAVVSLGVFLLFLTDNRSFCWTADTSAQYVPKVSYFISQTRELLQGMMQGEWNFKMYDFQIGLGDAVPLHMEPVYWLYLLFGESRLELAYGVLILLRYYLAGLSITAFMKYFRYTDLECLIGSMVYVFSGYGLFAGMQHSHFIIPMITLPLMLLTIEEIYHKKRWYLCTLMTALSFWCGYYFTYMNTILMGCYFLIRFFGGEEKKSVREFFLRARTIAGSYLLGIGIANITFFTTFASYLGSSRSGMTATQKVSLWDYGSKYLLKTWQSFLTTAIGPGNWLHLGFTALSYLAVVLLFTRRKNWQLKTGFLLGTLFCVVPVFGYVFSGFGTITNRWCYGYAFVVAVITAKMSSEFKRMNWKELVFMGCALLPYLYYGIGKKILGVSYKYATYVAGILLILTYLVVVLIHIWKRCPDRLKNMLILCSMTALLWGSGTMSFDGKFDNMIVEFTKSGKVWEVSTDTPLKVLDEVEDDSFYRSYARQKYTTQGASMMLGYNGVEYFNSTLSGPIVDFYREMGLTSWTLTKLKGFDDRGFLNALGCVKYVVMEENQGYPLYGFTKVKEILRDDIYYQVFENENVLSIGYAYDKVMSTEEMEKTDVPLRQEILLQAAVVDDTEKTEDVSIVGNSDIGTENGLNLTGKKITVTDIVCDENAQFDGKTITTSATDATITLYFDGLEDAENYLYIKGLSMKGMKKAWLYFQTDDSGESQSYCIRGDSNTYNTRQEDYVINLGYSKEKKTYCKIRIGKKGKLTLDDLAIYCQPMEALTTYTEQRKASALEDVKITNNKVTGTIQADGDKVLVFSIPYQNGWTAWVDGEKTPLYKANIMYSALNLKAGEHTVELVYETPGLRISLMVTAVSLIIFITVLMLGRKRKDAEKK